MNERVKLNVGGQRYEVLRSTLAAFPDTRLGRMFAAEATPEPDSHGEHFFDRNGRLFEVVLDYYRLGRLRIPPETPIELLVDELDYFGIEHGDLRPTAVRERKSAVNDDDDDDEEDEEDDEEELDEFELARAAGANAMTDVGIAKIWAEGASRADISRARDLLVELIQQSGVYVASDAAHERLAKIRREGKRRTRRTTNMVETSDEEEQEPADSEEEEDSAVVEEAAAQVVEPSEVPPNVRTLLYPLALAAWRLGDRVALELWLARCDAVGESPTATRTLRLVARDLRDRGTKLAAIAVLIAVAGAFFVRYWKGRS